MVSSDDVGPRRDLGAAEPWGRWNDERVAFTLREIEDLKTNLSGSSRTVVGVQVAVADVSQAVTDGLVKPVPPSNTRITSNTSQWTSGTDAEATVIVQWDAVNIGTAGEPVHVTGYEVWVHDLSDPEVSSYAAESLTGLKSTLKLPAEVSLLITTRAQGANGVWSDHSVPVEVTTPTPPSPTPKAPTNLRLTSNVSAWDSLGRPVAEISFEWDQVTQAIDGTPINIIRYELWEGTTSDLGYAVRSVVPCQADITLSSKSEVVYRARACSAFGAWSDFSNAVTVVSNVPPVDTTPPSTPIAVPGMASIEVQWDGKLAGAITPPVHIANILTYVADSGSGPWVLTGAPMAKGGAVTVRGDKGVQRWFRFQTVDTLGRLGGISASVSSAALGVGLSDIDSAITDAIDQAQEDASNALLQASSADGRVTVSANAPVPADAVGKPLGAVWFRRSVSNLFIGMWELTASGWVSRQFDDATIGNLNAATISAGILNVDRLGAKSVTMEKLIVSMLGNLIPNGDFRNGLAGWGGAPAEAMTVPDGPAGGATNVVRITPSTADQSFTTTSFPNSGATAAKYIPGATYSFKFRVRVVSGTAGSIRIRIGLHGDGLNDQWHVKANYAAADAIVGAWVELEDTFETPTENPRDRMSIAIHSNAAVGSVFEVELISMRQMASAELIVDGSITARQVNVDEFFADTAVINAATIAVLRAGIIETSMLSSGFGSDLNIQGNSSITLLAGKNADTQGQLDALQTYVRVDGVGLTLGATGNPLQAQMRPGAFAILDNGIETTYWESGRMIVPSLVTEEVVLSNHEFEKYGDGTVIRAL